MLGNRPVYRFGAGRNETMVFADTASLVEPIDSRHASSTWLYVDPARGAIVQRTDDTRRLRRWLYQGLHSLDFPGLYYKRPLWDIVVAGLSIGGLALSATTLLPAWRRLRRHARGLAGLTS